MSYTPVGWANDETHALSQANMKTLDQGHVDVGLRPIETISATGLNVTFSGIPQTFRHLLVVASPKHDGATNTQTQLVAMRFNGDGASNYRYARTMVGTSGTVSGDGSASVWSVVLKHGNLSGGALSVWIPLYRSTAAVGCVFGYSASSSVDGLESGHGSGRWIGPGPITEVRFVAQTDNHFNAVYTLYGSI